jgi:anti-anti-sigma regulatory factor
MQLLDRDGVVVVSVVAAIISTRNKIVAAGGKLAVAEVKDRVRSVFKVLKLERLFQLELSMDQALAAVK